MAKLRDYQEQAIVRMRDRLKAGIKKLILQAACGAGKTIIAAELARLSSEKGRNILFLVNRRDLVKQTVDKFEQFGLSPGVIMAGEDSSLAQQIQVASLQTYHRRLKFDDPAYNVWFHKADLVIYDEAHSCNAKTFRAILDLYADKTIIGLTATPCRSDGTGLGEVFEEIIQCISIKDLIGLGYLVPMVYYAPSKPDLDKIKIIAGDYSQKELSCRVDVPKLIGDIFDNWSRLAGNRQTIIFATDVKHSHHIKNHFQNRGISIEHIDSKTNDEDRVDIYNRFESGDVQVLTNVGICTEGSDFPFVSCVVLARPTKSLGRFIQMAGRGLRPDSGKTDCLLLDHSGAVEMHGFIDEELYWSLEGKKIAARKVKKRDKLKKNIVCKSCKFVFQSEPKCPSCGTVVENYGKKVETMEADLEQVKGGKKYPMVEKSKWWGMLEHERIKRGYAPGWTAQNYREKFGVWPRNVEHRDLVCEPDIEVYNWLKYKRIKYAKSMAKRQANGY